MSQLYGMLAGLFVCASTWGAMTYVSQEIGWLVGLFLLMFFTVTTIYINGDEMNERQKNVVKSLTSMEILFFERLKHIERKIDTLEAQAQGSPTHKPDAPRHQHELDTMINMVEQILVDAQTRHQDTGDNVAIEARDPDRLPW